MKLDVFNFIDELIQEVDDNMADIDAKAEEIKDYFRYILRHEDCLYDVSKRIKTADSISEKILRQNYYLKYKTVDNVLKHMSDIIGIRIQCLFIRDEKKLYEIIKDYFALEVEGYEDYYYNPRNEKIILKLDGNQPQTQANGFLIYRVDGKYLGEERTYNFEMQIKSFVNVFWGDIEHEILYKNFSYMITEDFVKEMLYSTKRSLEQIDAQLLAVHEYLGDIEINQEQVNARQLKRLVSKMIHDIYSVGFKDSTGVLLDFRASADLITSYLFADAKYDSEMDGVNYFASLMRKISSLDTEEFSYGGYLDISDLSGLLAGPSRRIGSGVASIVNADLKWNLILSIIFQISSRKQAEEYANFIDYLVYRISSSIDQALAGYRMEDGVYDQIRDRLMDLVVDFVCDHYDSDLFSDSNMTLIKNLIRQLLDDKTKDQRLIKDADLDYEGFDLQMRKEADF